MARGCGAMDRHCRWLRERFGSGGGSGFFDIYAAVFGCSTRADGTCNVAGDVFFAQKILSPWCDYAERAGDAWVSFRLLFGTVELLMSVRNFVANFLGVSPIRQSIVQKCRLRCVCIPVFVWSWWNLPPPSPAAVIMNSSIQVPLHQRNPPQSDLHCNSNASLISRHP